MTEYLVEILTTYIECLIGYFILFDVFKPERKLYIPLSVSVINTVVVIAINSFVTFSYTALIAAILLMSLVVKLITRKRFLNILGICTAYYTAVHLLDFLTLSLWCVYFGDIDRAVAAATTAGMERIIFIVFIKTYTIIIYCLIRKKLKHLNIDNRFIKFVIIISILVYVFDSVAVSAFLSNSYEMLRVSIAVEWVWAILLFAFTIYAFNMFSRYEKEKREYNLIEINNKMLSDNIENIKTSYYKNAKSNHDFKHHLSLIEGYIENNNTDKALKYIQGLSSQYVRFRNVSYTGIEELDIILNYKIDKAEAKGITVDGDFSVNDIGTVDVQDMCIILSNALDNAIEANESIEADKYIYISITQNNSIIIIKIENPTNNKIDNGIPESTKAEENHGWGLKSIISAVEKYKGLVRWECRDGIFTLTVSLF